MLVIIFKLKRILYLKSKDYEIYEVLQVWTKSIINFSWM